MCQAEYVATYKSNIKILSGSTRVFASSIISKYAKYTILDVILTGHYE